MAKDINSTILKKALQKLVPLFAAKIDTSAIGTANGVAALDSNGKVSSSILPSIPANLLPFSPPTAMTTEEGNALFDSVFNNYEFPDQGE